MVSTNFVSHHPVLILIRAVKNMRYIQSGIRYAVEQFLVVLDSKLEFGFAFEVDSKF